MKEQNIPNDLITPKESADRFMSHVTQISEKRKIVDNLNLMLCFYKSAHEPYSMAHEAVELNLLIERFGVSDVCAICVDTKDFTLRLMFTGGMIDE